MNILVPELQKQFWKEFFSKFETDWHACELHSFLKYGMVHFARIGQRTESVNYLKENWTNFDHLPPSYILHMQPHKIMLLSLGGGQQSTWQCNSLCSRTSYCYQPSFLVLFFSHDTCETHMTHVYECDTF